ncbi:hypothetical protein U1Q18_032905 [Sarracenia purpurea var. burkii]
MKPRTNGVPRAQSSKNLHGEKLNWMLIAGGALLSTLSIRLGYKLRQLHDAKQPGHTCNGLEGNGHCTNRKRSECCHLHSNGYCFAQDEVGCFNYISGVNLLSSCALKSRI